MLSGSWRKMDNKYDCLYCYNVITDCNRYCYISCYSNCNVSRHGNSYGNSNRNRFWVGNSYANRHSNFSFGDKNCDSNTNGNKCVICANNIQTNSRDRN